MPTRSRKVRRMRGSRTHGYGQVGQHRPSGKQGGHGQAGLHKHKWAWTVKFEPDHFGRDPFRPPRRTRPSRWINVVHLDGVGADHLPRHLDHAPLSVRSGEAGPVSVSENNLRLDSGDPYGARHWPDRYIGADPAASEG